VEKKNIDQNFAQIFRRVMVYVVIAVCANGTRRKSVILPKSVLNVLSVERNIALLVRLRRMFLSFIQIRKLARMVCCINVNVVHRNVPMATTRPIQSSTKIVSKNILYLSRGVS